MRPGGYIKLLADWIRNFGFFVNPAVRLTGRWKLLEYYTEPGDELIHLDKEQVKQHNLVYDLEFSEEHEVVQDINFKLPYFTEPGTFTWDYSKNFLTIHHSHSKSVTFQFAVNKGILKMLKKDESGKIEFFGFFIQPGN